MTVSPLKKIFFKSSYLLCLRYSRSKYNASTINYLLVFSTLRPKILHFMNTLIICYHYYTGIRVCCFAELWPHSKARRPDPVFVIVPGISKCYAEDFDLVVVVFSSQQTGMVSMTGSAGSTAMRGLWARVYAAATSATSLIPT